MFGKLVAVGRSTPEYMSKQVWRVSTAVTSRTLHSPSPVLDRKFTCKIFVKRKPLRIDTRNLTPY